MALVMRPGEITLLRRKVSKQARSDALRGFASSLLRDQHAVEAALTLPWSNGPVEGHVHRLKLIKRQMYGRASFDLLRPRVLHQV
jgi:transposase